MRETERVERLAARCAQQLAVRPTTFEGDRAALAVELQALLTRLQDADPRLAFDREGRPAAIAAIRQALPATEAELLDAVLDDVGCELAAWREALYAVAVAARGLRPGDAPPADGSRRQP